MKPLIFTLSLLALTGCTITRQAQVSEASPISGIVRLTYNQPLFFTSRTDDYVSHGTATRECQQMGYADAVSFGQPVGTCSIYAGSLCLNTRFTLSWQCRGVAVPQIVPLYY
ncbi:hypothetical protein AH332_14950 [Salmonella enterica subsp. salamae]|nr:hypothetical protein [Salmonella enterica subsp. salamae]ECI0414582.1 hypothetical protein [Salmonella enterica subsp. salamae]EDW4021828.1 hypothetical protein [Salmonella enterica subsp. salamae]EEP6921141.1 hypothetical protein [Salmonella enterica subsp. enterica]SQH40230.1 outer membrane lipoprotein [Salmonella enterica]